MKSMERAPVFWCVVILLVSFGSIYFYMKNENKELDHLGGLEVVDVEGVAINFGETDELRPALRVSEDGENLDIYLENSVPWLEEDVGKFFKLKGKITTRPGGSTHLFIEKPIYE